MKLMNVAVPSRNKIVIHLTHIEVLTLFNNYENLLSMSRTTKLTLNQLLYDIIKKHGSYKKSSEISARIKIFYNGGCEIILNLSEPKPIYNGKKYLFGFSDSENLIGAVIPLYLSDKNLKSHLYSFKSDYRLVLENIKVNNNLLFITEFCNFKSTNTVDLAITEEYGKLIVKNSAVNKLGSAFLKGF